MTTPLPGPLATLAPLLQHWGYAAVGLLVFLDNALVPVPGQTILIAASVYAGAGRLNIVVVALVALVAATAGGVAGYLIGRTGGRAFIHRFGRYVLLPPDRFAKAEDFFTRNGAKVVTFARFLDVLRQTGGALAGTTDMPWRRFAVYNALGAALWVGTWSALGYAAGSNIGPIYAQVTRYQLYVLAALAALALALAVRHLARRRRRAQHDDLPSASGPGVPEDSTDQADQSPPGEPNTPTPPTNGD
ncbi:membrane protein DedA with SNARE-associated domain [Streptacidiphilus sp. MAP12-16]|uniref:DedA family protein n=1 Tax=Streptacidiphilus sp. MAP12-16 TaxID=3156300 RepID=UPI003518DF81